MVDRERVDRLLARLADDIAALDEHRKEGRALTSRATELAAVKYRFITAIEGCARIAHHLISSEGWSVAETNADAVRRLGERRVVSMSTAISIAGAVGFRNVLVHQYAEVDDAKVIDNLGRLDDLESFVREVASWVSDRD